MNHIILIGFMGSGKTSVGKYLAAALDIPFIDMDELLVERAKMPITEIFEKYGEAYFRAMETELLKDLSQDRKRSVISVGGGVPMQECNHCYLKEMGTVIYLSAAVDTLVGRLQYDQSRPILRGGDLREKIVALQKERNPIYEQVGDVQIATDNRSFAQIAADIKKEVEKTRHIL